MIVVVESSPSSVMLGFDVGTTTSPTYVPGLMWIVVRSELFAGAASIAAWTVLKSPVPSSATVIVLAPFGDAFSSGRFVAATATSLAGIDAGATVGGRYFALIDFSPGTTRINSSATIGPNSRLPA